MVRRTLLPAPSISPYFRSLFAQQSTPITVQTCETPSEQRLSVDSQGAMQQLILSGTGILPTQYYS